MTFPPIPGRNAPDYLMLYFLHMHSMKHAALSSQGNTDSEGANSTVHPEPECSGAEEAKKRRRPEVSFTAIKNLL